MADAIRGTLVKRRKGKNSGSSKNSAVDGGRSDRKGKTRGSGLGRIRASKGSHTRKSATGIITHCLGKSVSRGSINTEGEHETFDELGGVSKPKEGEMESPTGFVGVVTKARNPRKKKKFQWGEAESRNQNNNKTVRRRGRRGKSEDNRPVEDNEGGTRQTGKKMPL